MDIRRPIWLQRVQAPGAEAFAVLFAIESLTRSLVVPIMPVEALRLLGSAQGVSMLFFVASLAGLAATLTVPALVRRIARRRVYTLGVLCLAAAPFAMMAGTLEPFAVGLALRVVGVVMMTNCLSLYILDHVARSDYSRSEPLRLMFAGAAWMIGPTLGAWLATQAGPEHALRASAASAVVLLAYFWRLRLRDARTLTRFKGRSPNPVDYIGRFREQPRLVFAWATAIGRYVWWVMFFIYVPIYAVQSGLGQLAGGIIISLGSGLMLFLPLLARLVRRFGIRAVMVFAFALAGSFTILMAALADFPTYAIAALFIATFGMVMLDAVANLPFMLAVRKHERPEMTAVYSSYRDVGEIAAPGVFAIVLKFAALPAVFLVTGLTLLGLSRVSRSVHPRLGRSRPRATD